MQLLNPVYGLVHTAVYPPTATLPESLPVVASPDNILDHTRRSHSTEMVIIPALLQIWSQSSDAIEILKALRYVVNDPLGLLANFYTK